MGNETAKSDSGSCWDQTLWWQWLAGANDMGKLAITDKFTLEKLATIMSSARFFMSRAWTRSAASSICQQQRIISLNVDGFFAFSLTGRLNAQKTTHICLLTSLMTTILYYVWQDHGIDVLCLWKHGMTRTLSASVCQLSVIELFWSLLPVSGMD